MIQSILTIILLITSANAFNLFNNVPTINKSWYDKSNNNLSLYITVVQGTCGYLYKVDKNDTYKKKFIFYVYQNEKTISKSEDKAVLCSKKIMSKYTPNEIRYVAMNTKSKERKEYDLYIKKLEKEANQFLHK